MPSKGNLTWHPPFLVIFSLIFHIIIVTMRPLWNFCIFMQKACFFQILLINSYLSSVHKDVNLKKRRIFYTIFESDNLRIIYFIL